MKALIALCLVAALVQPLAAQTSNAIIGIMVVRPKIDTTVVHPKDRITIPVVLSGDIGSLQLTLTYATTRLTFDSLRTASSWTVTSNASVPGKVVWNAFGTEPATVVARMYFTVKAPLGPTSLTPTVNVVGSLKGATVTPGFTSQRLVVCVRASGSVC